MSKESKTCPVCNKRICDVTKEPNEKVEVELKCPKCKHIVKVMCGKK